MMTKEHDYDYYLDLCLDLLCEDQYSQVVDEMIKMKKGEWFRLNSIQSLSASFPDTLYFLCKNLPNADDLLFTFINMQTLETSSAIYYHKTRYGTI